MSLNYIKCVECKEIFEHLSPCNKKTKKLYCEYCYRKRVNAKSMAKRNGLK